MGDSHMAYDGKDRRKGISDDGWNEYFGISSEKGPEGSEGPRTFMKYKGSGPKRKRKKNIIRKLGKNARPIILGIVALFLAVVLIIAAVGSSGGKEKSKDEQPVVSSAPDSRDEEISRLMEENAQKEQKIGEYESRISELEAQLAARKNGIQNGEQAKMCYLTFDDGPSDNTEKILDILKDNNVKATFFVIGGSKLDLVKRQKEEGHTVALHTYSHDYESVYKSVDSYFQDLQKISDAVENIIGEKSNVIRFPGGSSNTISKKYCPGIMTELIGKVEERGYAYFDWNVDSGDASGNNVPVDKIMNCIQSGGTSSSNLVVLMHDTNAKSTTVDALPKIIQFYRDAGYSFAGLSKDSPPVHHSVNN